MLLRILRTNLIVKIQETGFEGLYILEPRIFYDERGFFFESHNCDTLRELGFDINFVQDNQSYSKKGVVRGLHFQKPPFDQSKLIRVLAGQILDVVVDLRKSEKTYGKTYKIELSSANNLQLLVPRGFAHGFSVLSECAEILYKCDQYYHPEAEGGIHFNDPYLNIDWGISASEVLVSEKDNNLPIFDSVS